MIGYAPFFFAGISKYPYRAHPLGACFYRAHCLEKEMAEKHLYVQCHKFSRCTLAYPPIFDRKAEYPQKWIDNLY